MLNVRLAGDHLHGKQLYTWLSLLMSLMTSFCAVLFFPLDVLDEIWDLIESVSEGFLIYSYPFSVMLLQYQLPHRGSAADLLQGVVLHCHHNSHGCIVLSNILSVC